MTGPTLTGHLYASEYGQQNNLSWHQCATIVANLKPAILAAGSDPEKMRDLLEIET